MKKLWLVVLILVTANSVFALFEKKYSVEEKLVIELFEVQKVEFYTKKELSSVVDGELMISTGMARDEIVNGIWDNMYPNLVKMYSDLFTEKQLSDMITFYESDTGKYLSRMEMEIVNRCYRLSEDAAIEVLQ